MSPDSKSSTVGDSLQFDRAVPIAPEATDRTDASPICSSCSTAIPTEYFTVEGEPLCPACKTALEQQVAPVSEWSLVMRAGGFGLGAAIVGAGIYYGVIAITEFEIGLVAILIGYMVGYSVRKGAHGRGGMRLQIAAVALTYFSVAMAYLPLAIRGAVDSATSETASIASDSTIASAIVPDDEHAAITAADQSAETEVGAASLVPGIGMLFLFVLALPVLVVIGSFPSGLISALIIGIGMRQAWTMTGVPAVSIHGPYRVGADPRNPQRSGMAPA